MVRAMSIVLMCCLSGCVRSADATVEQIKSVRPSVVQVVAGIRGTAFHVGDGRFVTARHNLYEKGEDGKANVKAGMKAAVLIDHLRNEHNATFREEDADWDVAVIECKALSGLPALKLSVVPSDAGETILAYGFPFGVKSLTPARGMLAATEIDQLPEGTKKIRLLAVNLPIIPGMSGGPIVNAKNEVIGIIEANMGPSPKGFAIPNGFGYATGCDRAVEILKTLK